jgi:hypothetical protein
MIIMMVTYQTLPLPIDASNARATAAIVTSGGVASITPLLLVSSVTRNDNR